MRTPNISQATLRAPCTLLTCQVLMHSLHLHLGAGKCLFDGMVLLLLHRLHLLQHLPMGSLQLSLVHHDLGEEQVGGDSESVPTCCHIVSPGKHQAGRECGVSSDLHLSHSDLSSELSLCLLGALQLLFHLLQHLLLHPHLLLQVLVSGLGLAQGLFCLG